MMVMRIRRCELLDVGGRTGEGGVVSLALVLSRVNKSAYVPYLCVQLNVYTVCEMTKEIAGNAKRYRSRKHHIK